MPADTLQGFIEELGQGSHIKVEEDLGYGFVRLRQSEAERRQAAQDIRCSEDIVIEILRNARDAQAHNIFLAVSRMEHSRIIVCIDDGAGIPKELHAAIFDARVTSKLESVHMDKWGIHGRGMALYSVHENADFAAVEASAPGLGTSISIETNLSKLQEKADQSSFPTFVRDKSGVMQVRGVRNIIRTTCEFALEHRRDINVYLGSPNEIAATLYSQGYLRLLKDDLFDTSYDEVPYCWRPAFCSNPGELSAVCGALGLAISDRSARRILDGEIVPLQSMLDLVRLSLGGAMKGSRKRQATTKQKAPRIKITQQDQDALVEEVSKAFKKIAPSYYLQPDATVSCAIRGTTMRIEIPLIPDEE